MACCEIYAVLVSHARDGTERPVFQGGVKVGTVTEFDHRLAEWILQRKRPDDFGDKSKLEVTAKVAMTEEEELARGVKGIESITATIRHAARAQRRE